MSGIEYNAQSMQGLAEAWILLPRPIAISQGMVRMVKNLKCRAGILGAKVTTVTYLIIFTGTVQAAVHRGGCQAMDGTWSFHNLNRLDYLPTPQQATIALLPQEPSSCVGACDNKAQSMSTLSSLRRVSRRTLA